MQVVFAADAEFVRDAHSLGACYLFHLSFSNSVGAGNQIGASVGGQRVQVVMALAVERAHSEVVVIVLLEVGGCAEAGQLRLRLVGSALSQVRISEPYGDN